MPIESIKDEIDNLDKILDKFESEDCGLFPVVKVNSPQCLTMSIEELRKKSPDELSEYGVQIAQYSLFLQRTINKIRAREKWATSKLNEMASFYLEEANPSIGHWNMMHQAKHKPEICKKINAFIRKCSMELERLNDIPNHLRIMAETIKDLKFIAIRREKEYAKQ